MTTWLPIILVILAPGGVLVVLLEKMRKENNADHARNSGMLKAIDSKVESLHGKVDTIDERLDDHIEWHLGVDDVGHRRLHR